MARKSSSDVPPGPIPERASLHDLLKYLCRRVAERRNRATTATRDYGHRAVASRGRRPTERRGGKAAPFFTHWVPDSRGFARAARFTPTWASPECSSAFSGQNQTNNSKDEERHRQQLCDEDRFTRFCKPPRTASSGDAQASSTQLAATRKLVLNTEAHQSPDGSSDRISFLTVHPCVTVRRISPIARLRGRHSH